MSSVDRNALIEKFKNCTGVEDVQLSTFWLEASNWDVDRAIRSYYDNSSIDIQVEKRSKKPRISGKIHY